MDMQSGESIQLTNYKAHPVWGGGASLNAKKNALYYVHHGGVHALDIVTGKSTEIYHVDKGYSVGELTSSKDGRFLFFSTTTDKFDQFNIFRLGGTFDYRKEMNKFHEQDIHSKIIRIHTENFEHEIIHEEDAWIAHVESSPTDSNLLSFCHQGKTMKHRTRIWAMYLDEKKPWAVAPTHHDVLGVTHEQWLEDGQHLAYQAKGKLNGQEMFHGITHIDNRSKTEYRVPIYGTHHSSRNKDFFISDGNFTDQQYLYVFVSSEEGYDPPRKLCFHGSKIVHVHPSFSPSGKKLLYSSDKDGASAMYLIELPQDLKNFP